ncbi:chemotaxis protein CheW [Phenylobacterium sp.]|uniref:chemotaxis protein CheW n=1 Tax=Phenylobacterium sp. TaxID=1871053 RepID=UPI002731C996|nr:chemotaxis protein CheW [Phenylobacterium sp.]MDP1619106.1 chemotaxis protein CheW [Phenylobacterium sp.]MDP1987941.1 chemotaxis protein CheW [Phenylobacterium sp.]
MAPQKDTYLLLDVAGVDMALPMTAVAEILPVTRFERQAPWPKVLAGFMNLRGRPLAVIDLARVMNPQREPSKPDLYSHVIRLGEAHGGLALLIDRAKDAEVMADDFTEVDDDASANGVICGNLLILGRLTPLIDVDRLLLTEEELRVAEIAETLRTRLEASVDGEP